MATKFDRELEEKRKKRNEDLEEKLARCNSFWKIFFRHPGAYAILLMFLCTGIYYDWNLKIIIEKAFEYGVVALITSLIQSSIKKELITENE